MRLKNVLLVVSDLERSKAFYKELFGMEVLRNFEGNVVLAGGLALQEQTQWENCLGEKVEYGGCDTELYFEVYNLNTFIDKLEKSSYSIEYLNSKIESDSKCVVRIYDPDHHVIEVGEAL